MASQTPPPFKSPYGPPGVQVDTRKLIHFTTDGVQPPSVVYVDVNDSLFIELFSADNNPTFLVRYRILTPGGEIIQGQEQITYTATTRTLQSFTSQLTEGFLLSLEISNFIIGSETGLRGLTRCLIRILRGSLGSGSSRFLATTLVNGFLDQGTTLSWPTGLFEPTASGQGYMRSVAGTLPAAGAEISETVPARARWKFRTFRFQLITSATVATRGVTFLVDDGVNTLFQIEAPSSQAASLTQQYGYSQIGARADKVVSTQICTPFPDIIMAAGYRLRTATIALQAGDQYSAPQYQVEEWLVPQ